MGNFGSPVRLQGERNRSEHQPSFKCGALVGNTQGDRLLGRFVNHKRNRRLEYTIAVRLNGGAAQGDASRAGNELEAVTHLGSLPRETQNHRGGPCSGRKHDVWTEQQVADPPSDIDRLGRRPLRVIADDKELPGPADLTQPLAGEMVDISVEGPICDFSL